MTERLLQFIWQFQYYNKNELSTTSGEAVSIIFQGQFNHHQGPDFLEARIRLGKNTWVGSIELHINASDWHKHLHGNDPNYENVILHVVWKEDNELNDLRMPTLILGDRIPKLLIQQYESWLNSDYFIPCSAYLQFADDLVWTNWKERLLMERLKRKSKVILQHLEANQFHWEETLWWMISRNFGLVVNAEVFGEMADSVPYNILLKLGNQLHQQEALIFGQAGLLEGGFNDEYPLMLKKEYEFLRSKYRLEGTHIPVHYLRMRPACFPTIRLAQLAKLVYDSPQLFAAIIGYDDPGKIKQLLNVTAGEYWDSHFIFDEATSHHPKKLGAQMINNIIVNTVVPILYTYGEYRKEEKYSEKATDWISSLSPEKNSMTTKFKKYGVNAENAGESQALIELKTQYCDHRKCLDCSVGNAILKRVPSSYI
jgi:hypothetical protein